MTKDHRNTLRNIRTFPQLVSFLRSEMGWPINTDDFEEMTFDHSPEELGIDPRNAAKIQEIKRLRPLTVGQPWGIFFVKFEPKRLPVVALRRILSQVVLKKRAGAGKPDRVAWAMDDLLFVSNYGEGGDRRICLAHFTEDREVGNLAALEVLGWDGQDTGLHLDDVAEKLTRHLAWPGDVSDAEHWRDEWRKAFELRHREVITTSKALAERLAELARSIRAKVRTALSIESDRGRLRRIMKAFQESLIHDLDEDTFSDMYAQTIAYGLLSARVSRQSGALVADDAALILPGTNPFLKELMETFLHVGGRRKGSAGDTLDFDELGINEVVETLRRANMEAVLRDFGDKNPQEDPVIHFYEHFLAAYDKTMKLQRGVFYTPRPVVSYIVRSVDELLRTEFGLEDGLADTTTWGEMAKRHENLGIPEGTSPDQAFVQILDPACGTGTFLVEVIDVIHRTLVAKWTRQGCDLAEIARRWNEYVPERLLPRLHGYELLMAPYAIAHLKVGLKLSETGYRFMSQQRVRVFLTNSLESPSDSQLTLGFIPALAHEAQAVNDLKRGQLFTVIVANPPYSGHSSNPSRDMRGKLTFIGKLLQVYYQVDGRPMGERNPKWLQNDYVKFIRFAQWQIERTTRGVVAFITDNSYLDNPTFRGMRQSLMSSFNRGVLLDLHGNAKKKERAPNGGKDENVFDIMQGVAICALVQNGDADSAVSFLELYGTRDEKGRRLAAGDPQLSVAKEFLPRPPLYVFRLPKGKPHPEYEIGFRLVDILSASSIGVVTGNDKVALHMTRDEAKKAAKHAGIPTNVFRSVLYRPFDERVLIYDRRVVTRQRAEVARHLVAGDNPCIVFTRSTSEGRAYNHVFSAVHPVLGRFFPDSACIAYFAPLSLLGTPQRLAKSSPVSSNIAGDFLSALADVTGAVTSPKLAFEYIYGQLHSPTYRQRFRGELQTDFPRVLLPRSSGLLQTIAALGQQLMSFHLMDSAEIGRTIAHHTVPGRRQVGRPGWSHDTVWLDIDKVKTRATALGGVFGFRGVSRAVWSFEIGGYQVCRKWLADRKGRTLSDDDIIHYQKIVVALSETIRIMKEIDEVIEAHGGWPDAFAAPKQGSAQSKVLVFPDVAEATSRRHLKRAAEKKGKYTASPKKKTKE